MRALESISEEPESNECGGVLPTIFIGYRYLQGGLEEHSKPRRVGGADERDQTRPSYLMILALTSKQT
jgi:hypothetical protein